ncbi:hypothetical protein Tco_0338169, partial [Tanacetum coccineum]
LFAGEKSGVFAVVVILMELQTGKQIDNEHELMETSDSLPREHGVVLMQSIYMEVAPLELRNRAMARVVTLPA